MARSAIFGNAAFTRFWMARSASGFAYHLSAVAIGWQVYGLTGRVLDLGLVGLVEFTPQFLLTLVVGQVADRLDRRRIASVCQAIQCLALLLLMDLEKFFDRVNHDVLMARVARKVEDKRVLGLIRRYLQAGMLTGGLMCQRTEGTPQGGPLSPLLSNILLDDLDKELEKRGHTFCRYADDCNIYVRTRRSGERVMASLTQFLTDRLKLRVNVAKSAVERPWKRKFLGYSMTWHKEPRLKVAPQTVKRFKGNVRELFRKGRGRSLAHTIDTLRPKLRGWVNYFKLAEVKGAFEELDEWLRRKLRCLLWRHWKRPYARARNLMRRGLSEEQAWRSATNGRGPWWNAGASHMTISRSPWPGRFRGRPRASSAERPGRTGDRTGCRPPPR